MGFFDIEGGELGKRLSCEEDVTGVLTEAGAVAVGARTKFLGVEFCGEFFFVNFGFGFGVEAL